MPPSLTLRFYHYPPYPTFPSSTYCTQIPGRYFHRWPHPNSLINKSWHNVTSGILAPVINMPWSPHWYNYLPAPAASRLMNALRLSTHGCWVIKPWLACKTFSSAPLKLNTNPCSNWKLFVWTRHLMISNITAQLTASSFAPGEPGTLSKWPFKRSAFFGGWLLFGEILTRIFVTFLYTVVKPDPKSIPNLPDGVWMSISNMTSFLADFWNFSKVPRM